MTYTKKQRESYNLDREIKCQRLEISKNDYNWFRRVGEELHKYYEFDCNGVDNFGNEWTEEKSQEAEGKLQEKAISKATKLGLDIYFQTDPRGGTIYLSKELMTQSTYSSKGSLIY